MAGQKHNNLPAYNKKSLSQKNLNRQLLPLLSPERESKADLLLNLITNFDQPIILCGSKGVGKTAFLRILEVRKAPLWITLYLQATAETSVESIIRAVAQVLKQVDIYREGMTLEEFFKQMTVLNDRFVLLIDDADLLEPGLLTTLIQLNKDVPVLRIIATLSQREVFTKTANHAIDDCKVVKIPNLTERQTIELVSYVIKTIPSTISTELLNSTVLDNVYHSTRGNPGEILDLVNKFPKLIIRLKYQKMGFFVAGGCFFFLLIGIMLWGDRGVASLAILVVLLLFFFSVALRFGKFPQPRWLNRVHQWMVNRLLNLPKSKI